MTQLLGLVLWSLPIKIVIFEGDVMIDEAECEALVSAMTREIKLKNQIKAKHLRPLYIMAYMNGKLISRVLVDGEAMFNIIPYSTVEKLG